MKMKLFYCIKTTNREWQDAFIEARDSVQATDVFDAWLRDKEYLQENSFVCLKCLEIPNTTENKKMFGKLGSMPLLQAPKRNYIELRTNNEWMNVDN